MRGTPSQTRHKSPPSKDPALSEGSRHPYHHETGKSKMQGCSALGKQPSNPEAGVGDGGTRETPTMRKEAEDKDCPFNPRSVVCHRQRTATATVIQNVPKFQFQIVCHLCPHKPWLFPESPKFPNPKQMSLTASCSQGRHKSLWETQGLTGALGPLPRPDWSEQGRRV